MDVDGEVKEILKEYHSCGLVQCYSNKILVYHRVMALLLPVDGELSICIGQDFFYHW